MVDRNKIVAAIEEYCRTETEKDKQGWLNLFAENIKHEDPVGSERVNIGLEQLTAFWDSFQPANVELWLTDPIIVCGKEAIALLKARVGPPDDRTESGQIVNNFIFDNDGKITNVRAFFER